MIIPVACRETLEELRRVLSYPKFRVAPAIREDAFRRYWTFCDIVPLTVLRSDVPVSCRDRDDYVFLQLALSADVVLVSGDKDLTMVAGVMPVLSARALRAMIDAA